LKREFVYDSAFFLNRTPGRSPFVNSTPAASRAFWIAESVDAFGSLVEVSMLMSAVFEMPAFAARSD
jgi:hypothetical protein